MTSSNSIVIANRLKQYRPQVDDVRHIARSRWFVPPTSGNARVISRESIARFSDEEYLEWRTPHPDIQHMSDMSDKLDAWLRAIDVHDLATLLDATPEGVAADADNEAFLFTPWQRLSMAVYVRLPFGVSSKVMVEVEDLRRLAQYRPDDKNQRAQPLQAQYSRMEGSFPSCGIIDLPTAGGKTAWSLSVGFMAVADGYARLVSEYRERRLCEIFQGPLDMPVARLVLVATTATTFDHFVTTLRRLLPAFRAMTDIKVQVWSKMSKFYSVGVAAENDRDTVTFWVIPVSKLNAVLRTHPNVAVPVCITDEFTVDTPRERSRTAHSTVMKQIITQATPQALTQATRGGRSWFKELMGGYLHAPSDISELLRFHNFSEAQLAIEQLCQLDLMTMTAFRARVRDDLAALMPPSLEVVFVKSRRTTMASYLSNSQTDFVPANFANVLVSHLRPMNPTAESVANLRGYLARHTDFDIEGLVQQVLAIKPTYDRPDSTLTRLADRLREFHEGCAVCFETHDARDVRIFGCCGCCTCNACFKRVSRCPFCRAEVPIRIAREDAMLDEPDTTEPSILIRESVAQSIAQYTTEAMPQLHNLTASLKVMREWGYRRILIISEMPTYYMSDDDVMYRHMGAISSEVGIRLLRVDAHLTGKGTEFTRIKHEFDTSVSPIALVCSGLKTQFLVGTDLAHADSIVTVGHIPDSILTQSLGRIFRPLASRNNTHPVLMVKVFT